MKTGELDLTMTPKKELAKAASIPAELMRKIESWGGKYSNILVTGPQRSGTRIGAKIIACETSFAYQDEEAFETHDRQKFRRMARNSYGLVLQCPTMMRWIHEDGLAPEGVAKPNLIVVMERPLLDIYRSEERIKYQFEGHEMAKYVLGRPAIPDGEGGFRKPVLLHEPRKGGDGKTTSHPAPRSAEIKYYFFETVQQKVIEAGNAHWTILSYDKLEGHPLWVPKEARTKFEWNQTA